MSRKFMPAREFVEVFGNYVPRLCVDTAVIGPDDQYHVVGCTEKAIPQFACSSELRIALKERDEEPRLGQWGIPGGTMLKGETPFDASRRIIKAEFDIDIEPLCEIGTMHFPDEHRSMLVDGERVDFVIDSCSIVVLARAKSSAIRSPKGKRIEWCKTPPVAHDIHTPFLVSRGLLKAS